MKPLFEWITTERDRRLFSGTTNGVRDVTDSPEKVRARQAKTEKLLKFSDDPRHEVHGRRGRHLLPTRRCIGVAAANQQSVAVNDRQPGFVSIPALPAWHLLVELI